MFFQEVPPDTSVYMIAGYVIFFAVTAIYVASLFIRTRNLSRDLQTLKEAEEEQRARVVPPPAPSRAASKPKAARAKTARTKTGKPKRANRRSR